MPTDSPHLRFIEDESSGVRSDADRMPLVAGSTVALILHFLDPEDCCVD